MASTTRQIFKHFCYRVRFLRSWFNLEEKIRAKSTTQTCHKVLPLSIMKIDKLQDPHVRVSFNELSKAPVLDFTKY